MSITNTQEEYEIRSISKVHINPSIMEGTQQLTSILGSKRSKEIVRYAPFFTVNALLTGDPGIPSWLECSPGVVDASPQAFRSYQWYADGVLINGATNNRFQTTNAYDGKTMKCMVRAFNILGEDFSESNEILVTAIEPIFVREADYYPITGLGTDNVETVLNMSFFPITGMSVSDAATIFGLAMYPIQGMAIFEAVNVSYFDIYAANFFVLQRTFSLSNAGAESNSSAGWTVVSGSFNAVTGLAKAGSRYFESATPNVLSKITRTVAISDSADLAYVAAGNAAARVNYSANNDSEYSSNLDELRVYIEALNASNTVVATLSQFGWVKPVWKNGTNNIWQDFPSVPEVLPATTTQLRIVIEFTAESGGNDCQIDEIGLQLFRV